MELLKKVGGYLILIIAIIFSMSAIATFPKGILDSIIEIKKDTASGIGFLLGTLVVEVLFIFLILYLFKKGSKLIRTKHEK